MNNIFKFLCILCLLSTARAATILQSKNGKVLLALEGETLSIGQNIGFKNADGKTVAVASVTIIKGTRAIVEVKKGQLSGGETVFFGGVKAKPKTEEAKEESFTEDSETASKKEVFRLNATKISGVLTIGMNNMTTKQADSNVTPNTEEVALKGNSFGLTGILDLPVGSWLIARGTFGYEPFTAEGTGQFLSCDNQTSTNCSANINYLSTGGYARINFTKSKLQLWGALGGTMKFPISKTSTALKTDDIKLTFTFAGAGGLDYFISNKYFIPVSFEYQVFQSSDTVSANLIQLRAGFGMAL